MSIAKRLGRISLLGTIVSLAIVVSVQAQPASQRPPNGNWDYSQFIQAVKKQTVRKVGVNPDRTRALVETKDGRRIWVSLQNDPNLIETLTRNDVDIYVMSRIQRSPHKTWEYRQFMQAVEQKKVRKVRLFADRTRLIAETKEGNRFWVNLQNDPELLNMLTRNHVDILVMPKPDDPSHNSQK